MLETKHVYFPESKGAKSFSFKYHMSVLIRGCSRLCMLACPSFSHWNFRGVDPLALHFSRTLCRAGHAINFCFILVESTNLGESKWENKILDCVVVSAALIH